MIACGFLKWDVYFLIFLLAGIYIDNSLHFKNLFEVICVSSVCELGFSYLVKGKFSFDKRNEIICSMVVALYTICEKGLGIVSLNFLLFTEIIWDQEKMLVHLILTSYFLLWLFFYELYAVAKSSNSFIMSVLMDVVAV